VYLITRVFKVRVHVYLNTRVIKVHIPVYYIVNIICKYSKFKKKFIGTYLYFFINKGLFLVMNLINIYVCIYNF
jgi:hypothetical protein